MDDRGSLEKAQVIQALQDSGDADYDSARETLKDVNIDSAGRVEMEDWVQLHSLLKKAKDQPVLESNKGKISVKGTAGTNASHTINEDERTSFTDHINGVSVIVIVEGRGR